MLSRSHGRRRASFYACSVCHHRGSTVCDNRLNAPMHVADDAIFGEIEGYVLHPEVVNRAVALALDQLCPKGGKAAEERGRVQAQIRSAERELERLAEALATGGGALPSLLSALQARERRKTELEDRLAGLDGVRAFTSQDAARVESDLRAKLRDWRALLRGEVPAARQILRALLQDRIEFTPAEQEGQQLYRYRGSFNLGSLFAGVIDPQALASPTGRSVLYQPTIDGEAR